jgi:ATP-dependent DNA helicase DinG
VSSSSQPASATPANRSENALGSSLYNFFGPGGLLSRTHPAYEFRRGQLQMAEAVEKAIGERRQLIVEAGTGTGKHWRISCQRSDPASA